MTFGPKDIAEAEAFALEELRADIQYQILKALKVSGKSQADLASALSVKPAWISQVLGDDANLTLDSISKIFLALDLKCHVSVAPLESHYSDIKVTAREAAWTEDAPVPQRSSISETGQFIRVLSAGRMWKNVDYDCRNDNHGATRELEAA